MTKTIEHIDYTQVRKESAYKLPTYIFDVDGTLCKKGDRHIHDHRRVAEDDPIEPVLYIAQRLSAHATILVVSGRQEISRLQTQMWLHAHYVDFHELFMRATDDNRPDHEVKLEIYERDIKPYYPNIYGAFDDRLSVIDNVWLKVGIFTFNVNNGKGAF